MTRTLVVIALLIGAVGGLCAQSVSSKKKELEDLRRSIKSTQQQIDKLAREERSTKSTLSTYQRQRHQISQFITSLEADLQRLKDSASALKQQIGSTQAALAKAESDYNKLVGNMLVYKAEHRGMADPKATNNAVFEAMSHSLASYRRKMITLRDSLAAEENLLEDYSATRDSVLSTMNVEERRLSTSITSSKRELTKIKRDKSSLNKQLKQKQQSANKLRQLINKLVAEAQRKAEEERKRKARKSGKSAAPAPSSTVKGFAARSLPWPTSSQKILHGYGSYKNPETGTMLDNPGIDIATKSGSTVKAVAGGEVSSVTFLPGFQSLVIIDHGNGVRSVYANLETVSVGKGAKVNAGTTLGTSGESIDGELVHFEIWNGKARQDPRRYLR